MAMAGFRSDNLWHYIIIFSSTHGSEDRGVGEGEGLNQS